MLPAAPPASAVFQRDKFLARQRALAAMGGGELVAVDLDGRLELVLTKGPATWRFARWESDALARAVAELGA